MKLSGIVAKLTSGKVKVLSTLGGLAIAGAAMTMAAPTARAQVAFGVEMGGPRYYAPAPPPQPVYVTPEYGGAYGYDTRAYWEHRRYQDWRAREWREHERERWQERRDAYRHDGFYDHDWR